MQVSVQGASLQELASRYGVGLPTAVCLSSIMMDIRDQLEAELSRMVRRANAVLLGRAIPYCMEGLCRTAWKRAMPYCMEEGYVVLHGRATPYCT